MFDRDDASAVVAEIEVSQRQESSLMAHRMDAIAALLVLRTADAEAEDPDPGWSMITGFARTSAEVGAAMNMPPMDASKLVAQADALDNRLPRLAALLSAGEVDWPTARLIIRRTELVDDDLIARIDEEMADRLRRWHTWSRRRVTNAVDELICSIDPEAAKERRASSERDRYVTVTSQPDGSAHVRGRLPATAGVAFDKRLTDMAKAVCARDSRTLAQRRADALTALLDGRGLACDCAQPDCPARGSDEPSSIRTVVNVITSEETLLGQSDQPGYLEGFGVIDADLVRDIAEDAALCPLGPPSVTPEEAVRYQPTAEVDRWVRLRDLTCRFAGCDRPVTTCDLDHTTPFNHADPSAGGLTVPWGLSDYCREHHRLKTFHGGPEGWRDEQLDDGTIVWTSPTGRTYRTTPLGSELFPQMRLPCVEPRPRRRNRARERAATIRRLRSKLREQRPVNAAQRDLDRARRREIDERKWRNNSRKLLIVLKGRQQSTSPFARWINDPFESEELPPDWRPPPRPPTSEHDEPPF